MKQLAQRVAASFHLGPDDCGNVPSRYIRHGLGGRRQRRGIHPGGLRVRSTPKPGGVPRLVNQLCDFAMLYAWSAEEKVVTEDLIQGVMDDGVYMSNLTDTKDEGA